MAVHPLLGTTFANVTKLGAYRSEKAAALDFARTGAPDWAYKFLKVML